MCPHVQTLLFQDPDARQSAISLKKKVPAYSWKSKCLINQQIF